MSILRISCALLLAAAPLAAQTPPRPTTNPSDAYRVGEFIVKTVPLRHLTSAEAVKLLSPYVENAGGGVYEVGQSIRAVTIRETMKPYMQMMQVLGQYDRDPATVTLNFQLVAADNSGQRDQAVAGLDSVLRGVLKFSGYRLLTTAVLNVGERATAQQSLSVGGVPYKLFVDVADITSDGANASIRMHVTLARSGVVEVNGLKSAEPSVLSTGVTIPIGNTVVLGTSVEPGKRSVVDGVVTSGDDRALILTVRPQIVATPTKKD
jgi:hypothetical protein